MTDDIVARLRVWSDWLNERCPDTEVRNDLRAAADEIERLRKERDDAEPLLNELWERRTQSTEMRAEIERLRAERDEVRQSYCSLMEEAIAEIKRLRQENATLTAERDALFVLTDRLTAEHDALRAERDEARWRLCKVVGDNRNVWGCVIAKENGWDYLATEETEATNGSR